MKITPSTLPINSLLANNSEQFFIPPYQRRYSWCLKQYAELFNDIVILKNDDSHLMGTILCLSENHRAGLNVLELVDGQQRLITLSLLLRAIKIQFNKFGDTDTIFEIDNLLICKDINKNIQNKIILGDLDEDDYKKIIKNSDSEIKNNNLLHAYEYFNIELEKLTEKELSQFYYKLKYNLYIIRLDVPRSKDAYKLFETINNRGLRLTPTDIIKNFLLGHASLLDKEILEDVKDNWKSIIVNLDGISTDQFFRQYMCSILTRKISMSKLIDEFKKYYLKHIKEANKLPEFYKYFESNSLSTEDYESEEITEENDLIDTINEENSMEENNCSKISILELTQKLKSSSRVYSKLLKCSFPSNEINKELKDLKRIKAMPAYIFLLDVFSSKRRIDESIKIEIIKLIQTFMMRRHICEKRTGELDNIFSVLTRIETTNIVEDLKINLKDYYPPNEEFKIKFKTHSFKGNEERAKYIFEKIEYDKIKDKGEYELKSGNDVHLEHIIPQKIKTLKSKGVFGNWIEYLGETEAEKHKIYVDTIGNLTIISSELNIIATNDPYLSKVEEYKKSNIFITKEIPKKYEQFRFKEVEKRAEELSELALSIWTF